jgi:hypothetical protein
MHFQPACDLHGALHRVLGMGEKHQDHSVPGGDAKEFFTLFRAAKLVGRTHHVIELAEQLSLLIDHQLGITDNVGAQDVRDFKLRPWVDFRRHVRAFAGRTESFQL